MIALGLVLLAAVAMAPLAVSLTARSRLRGRRESALAVHRAQLAELDHDLADGRIQPTEHASAMLEVQRRLLTAADTPEEAARNASPWLLAGMLLVVPVAGASLYLINGHPDLPAQPIAGRQDEARQQTGIAEAEALVAALRTQLAQLDPKSPKAREGYLLLGNAEASLGHLTEAATAWKMALDTQFDPVLAAQTAEAQARADGKVSAATASLFERALESAPPNAPWRALAEQRIAESKAGK